MRFVVLLAFAFASTPAAAQSRLLGVDRSGKQAFVTREGAGWSLETVDVDTGKSLATWSASPENVADRTGTMSLIKFFPVDGTIETDLVKLAAITARTVTASRPFWTNVQRTAKGIVYQNDSSIELADASGQRVATLGDGWNPRVSPNGKLVAWIASENSIAVTEARSGATPVVAKLGGSPRSVQWSVDGSSLLMVGIDGCIHRLAAKTLKDKKLYCEVRQTGSIIPLGPKGVRNLVQDPTGRTLAMAGDRDVVWLDAKTGKKLGTVPLSGGSLADDDATLGPKGLYVVLGSEPTELLVADLARGTTKKLTARTFFEGVRATHWTGTSIVVLDDGDVQRIDVAKAR